jgi:hypothetical protein
MRTTELAKQHRYDLLPAAHSAGMALSGTNQFID